MTLVSHPQFWTHLRFISLKNTGVPEAGENRHLTGVNGAPGVTSSFGLECNSAAGVRLTSGSYRASGAIHVGWALPLLHRQNQKQSFAFLGQTKRTRLSFWCT